LSSSRLLLAIQDFFLRLLRGLLALLRSIILLFLFLKRIIMDNSGPLSRRHSIHGGHEVLASTTTRILRCLTPLNPFLLLSDITLNLKDALFALAILIDI